jgi:hypothetical protein
MLLTLLEQYYLTYILHLKTSNCLQNDLCNIYSFAHTESGQGSLIEFGCDSSLISFLEESFTCLFVVVVLFQFFCLFVFETGSHYIS